VGSSSSLVFGVEDIDQILQRCQLLLVDKIKLFDEEDEVFERRVKVSLFVESLNVVAMLVVDVRVNAEQSLQNRLRHRQKVPRKRNALHRHEILELMMATTY